MFRNTLIRPSTGRLTRDLQGFNWKRPSMGIWIGFWMLTASSVAVAEAPRVYGYLNLSVDQTDTHDRQGNKVKVDSGTQIHNRTSHLGVKGQQTLTPSLTAIYHLSYEIQIDGEKDALTARDQFVGLTSSFGTLLAGRHDTPLMMSAPNDLFDNGILSDHGPMAGGLGVYSESGEYRAPSTLLYQSPSFGGLALLAGLAPANQDNPQDNLQDNQNTETALDDLMSLAFTYDNDKAGLYLAAAYNHWQSANFNSGGSAEEVRLSAQYQQNGFIGNLLVQHFGGKALKNTYQAGDNVQLQLGYQFERWLPKLKISQVNRTQANGEAFQDSTNTAIGLNITLGKATIGYVEFARLDKTATANGEVAAGESDHSNQSAYSIGLIHEF